MSYYFNKTILDSNFEETIQKATDALKAEGFGVLTEIDVKQTLKNKIDVDFKKYKILGACNPGFAYKALQAEDKIGVFLPCNVVVEENEDGSIEVTAVDPVTSMQSVGNKALSGIAGEVQSKLRKVIESI